MTLVPLAPLAPTTAATCSTTAPTAAAAAATTTPASPTAAVLRASLILLALVHWIVSGPQGTVLQIEEACPRLAHVLFGALQVLQLLGQFVQGVLHVAGGQGGLVGLPADALGFADAHVVHLLDQDLETRQAYVQILDLPQKRIFALPLVFDLCGRRRGGFGDRNRCQSLRLLGASQEQQRGEIAMDRHGTASELEETRGQSTMAALALTGRPACRPRRSPPKLSYFETLFRQTAIEIMNSPRILTLIASLLLFACDRERREENQAGDSALVRDTGPAGDSGPACDSGQIDDDGECVPAACGSGTWGDLDLDKSTVYVDVAAAEGGNGSQDAPLSSIQAGLDAAGDAGGGMVAVAAGSYAETLELGYSHAGVHLAGRCQELVIIDASEGGSQTPGIHVDAKSAEVGIWGVTVSGSRYVGVLVGSGTLTLRGSKVEGSEYLGIVAYQAGLSAAALALESCEVWENGLAGVIVYGSSTSATLLDSTIQGSAPGEGGEYGYGINVYDGASLEVEACQVWENASAGILAAGTGTSVTLLRTSFRDTQRNADGIGHGIEVYGGANLEAEDCEVAGNAQTGVLAMDSGTTIRLRETSIQDTLPDENGFHGYGIQVGGGANLEAESCEVAGSRMAGVLAYDSGTTVALRDTAVRDTRPDGNGEFGFGILGETGASLEVEACELTENSAVGVLARDAGTTVALRETSIQGTLPDGNGEFGYGLQISEGASLEAESCAVSANTAAGVVAYDAGTAVALRDTNIQGTLPSEIWQCGFGVEVGDGATLAAESCEVAENTEMGLAVFGDGSSASLVETTIRDTKPNAKGGYGYGIEVGVGASLSAQSCVVEGNTALGVLAFEPDTTVVLRETRIASTGRGGVYTVGIGVVAQGAATVEATNIEVDANQGPGLFLASAGSHLSCSSCTLRDNRFAGAVVVDGASLSLAASSIEGTTEQENLGGGFGLYAEPWSGMVPSLTVTSSTIQHNPIAGVWLAGEGSYSLSDNAIHGGDGWTRETLTKCGDAVYARDGVRAWDGNAGLLLQNNELLDGLGAGLFLDGASASLSGNRFADNAVDLIAQGPGCETLPDGYHDEAINTAELCPSYSYATSGDRFMLRLELATPGYGDGETPAHDLMSGFVPVPGLQAKTSGFPRR